MSAVTAVILLHAGSPDDGTLTLTLRDAQRRLAERHERLFRRAGADVRVDVEGGTFAERVRRHAARGTGGLVVLGGGAVARLNASDAARLVAVAARDTRDALTNNRYSSDVCAVAGARVLSELPALPGDNALPRWLEETHGYHVSELPARDRLAFDVDTPLDLALLSLDLRAPRDVAALARDRGLAVPRRNDLLAVVTDPRAELLVFGRTSSRTLAWLEQHLVCRVRFLAEERGLRASSPLVRPPRASAWTRPPRATLGRLLAARGPDALAQVVGELADGAVIDSRVLLADRLGVDESTWPSAEDRFTSDLLRAELVSDPWLAALTRSAAESTNPILLGGHTLVGPGLQLLFEARGGSG